MEDITNQVRINGRYPISDNGHANHFGNLSASYSASSGRVYIRLDDAHHLDFWLEIDLNVATLEKMINEAKNDQE